MGALDRLDVQVQTAGARVGANGSIAGVGKRAGLAVAEACHVVFVAAEVGRLGGESIDDMSEGFASRLAIRRSVVLEFEGAELLVDDIPDNFIGRHCGCSRRLDGADLVL